MILMMFVESLDFGKYVVYIVILDESSMDLEDGGYVNFKDIEMDFLNSKFLFFCWLFRFFLFDFLKWSVYWFIREKCCCLWNVVFVLVIFVLIFVVVYIIKNGVNNGLLDVNYIWNFLGIYFVSMMILVGLELDISKVCWGFFCGYSICVLWILVVIREIGVV